MSSTCDDLRQITSRGDKPTKKLDDAARAHRDRMHARYRGNGLAGSRVYALAGAVEVLRRVAPYGFLSDQAQEHALRSMKQALRETRRRLAKVEDAVQRLNALTQREGEL